MLRVVVAALLACGCVVLRAAPDARAEPVKLVFDRDATGAAPAGFSTDVTNGPPGTWVVEADTTATGGKVLVQRSTDPTSGRFPLCIYDGVSARDVVVTVRFKPISGEEDRAAGIVWRYRDSGNYYVVRANALEGNVVLYEVEAGKRRDLKPIGAGMLAYGKKVDVPSGAWSTLRVEANDARFAVSLDGRHLFDVEDDTFREPGRVGLWTKADSVTAFDDLEIEPRDAASR
ncbi:MAG: family 16 glycoside hydrolase [Thermodesulfobacteriota bacterium]